MRKTTFPILLSLIAFALFVPSRCVRDDDMSRSIQPKDLVWIWKTEPKVGDVLLIQNPLDPTETILRRFVAGEGETVLYDRNGTVRVAGKGIRQRDMGNEEPHRIIEETIWRGDIKIQWRIERLLKPVQLRFEPIVVPKDHMYLLCDRRDECVDSRLWGAIHKRHFVSSVRARIGKSDPWRPWFEWYP